MQFTAHQIAQIIQGYIEGDPETVITDIAKIEEASENSLSFIANPKYEHFLYETKAGIIILGKHIVLEKPINATLIRVEDAYLAFTLLLEQYQKIISEGKRKGIEQPSFIHDTAIIGENVYIGAFSYIGKGAVIEDGVQIYPQSYIGNEVKIERNSIIYAGAKIYDHCKIGSFSIIHSGVVIGADGFGFAPQTDGTFKKVPQLGNVIIEDYVEIGANTTIDKATMGSTTIKKHVKLDNLIQVAHNVTIGENTVIAAQTGVSGSTIIGKNCIIGGQVGIAGHIAIGDNVKIQAQSGIGRNVKDNETLQGTPALGYSEYNKSYVHFKNLPKIVGRLNTIEKNLDND